MDLRPAISLGSHSSGKNQARAPLKRPAQAQLRHLPIPAKVTSLGSLRLGGGTGVAYVHRTAEPFRALETESRHVDLGLVRHTCSQQFGFPTGFSFSPLLVEISSHFISLLCFGRHSDTKLPSSLKLSARLVPLPRDGSPGDSCPSCGSG